MKSININEYVDFYIERQYSDYMEDYEVDDLEDYRETLVKNVRNTLKEFNDFQPTFSIENTSIFQYFPYHTLSTQQQYDFLDHLLFLKYNDFAIGNKVIHNLKKITYDLDDSRYDALSLKETVPTSFTLQLGQYKNNHRHIIRNDFLEIKQLLSNNELIANYVIEKQSYQDLYTLLNIYTDSILQAINYWVITCDFLDMNKRMACLLSLHAILDKLLDEVTSHHQTPKNTKLSSSLDIYITLLKYRNRCGEHLKLSSYLKEEQENEASYFQPVKKEYFVTKSMFVENQNIKAILNEGNGRCDHFEEKLIQTKAIIELLSKNNGRNVDPNNLLDLKVYFRELYISKSKYKTTAATIAKKYIDSPNQSISLSDERFLNEKISRGYFREQIPLVLYDYKNMIQHKLYLVIIQSLLCYDLNEIVSINYQITNLLIKESFMSINEVLPDYNRKPIF